MIDADRFLVSVPSEAKIEEWTDGGATGSRSGTDFVTGVTFAGHMAVNSNRTHIYVARGFRVRFRLSLLKLMLFLNVFVFKLVGN